MRITRKDRLRTISDLQSQYLGRMERSPADEHRPHTCGRINPLARDPGVRPKTCQWLEGEPKQRLFCGVAVQDHSSYCPDHHKRCYVKITLTEDESKASS